MELTLIIAGVLAIIAAGTAVVAASARAAGAHLLDAGGRAAGWVRGRWLHASWHAPGVPVRSRVLPGRLFSSSSALGLAVIVADVAVTGALVDDITEGGGVAVLDHPVARFVATHRSAALTAGMRAVSIAGSPPVLAIVTAAAGVLFAVSRRRWGPVVLASVAVAGSEILTLVIKDVLGRSRPPLSGAVAVAGGYGFPSAHAAAAVAAFGVLAYLGTEGLRSRAGRVAGWAIAATLTALVGISRVYLGVHWMTDVLGGWTVGVIWLAVVLTGWTAVTQR